MERKFSFRERLEQVHVLSRDASARPKRGELVIDESWDVVVPDGAGLVVATAAADLRDYFQVAMGARLGSGSGKRITLKVVGGSNRCRIVCDGTGILVAGSDEKLVARGCHELENLLNLRRGPFLKPGEWEFENRFSPRMVHSGWDFDVFPDQYLNQIAHHGFDSVLVYYRRSDVASPEKIAEVEDLIKRASAFGIGVYLYLQAYRDYDTMHPSEPGAESYYDSFYGQAFRNHPGAAGCVMVGESCAFPSRDPGAKDIRDGSSDNSKPHPGWWPCSDYPEWLALVKKVVTKQKPDADIVFWTYNWGWAPREKRLELIKNLPSGVSLLVTFEMFECVRKGEMLEHCADYTIKITGPGGYFASEAQAAKARGLRLYAMSNTGGQTWDFGAVPYIPVPLQWAGRWQKLLEARRDWGLSGLMESHHYGWHPSHVSRLGRYFAASPETDKPESFLRGLAEGSFGVAAGRRLMTAWRLWSKSIGLLPATAYDQYGPLRVGPSYPLHFFRGNAPNLPSDPGMRHGSCIVEPFYAPEGFFVRGPHNDIPIQLRVEHELRSVKRLEVAWQKGLEALEGGLSEVSAQGRGEYVRILALGRFIGHTLRTLRNAKQWWKLRMKLREGIAERAAAKVLGEMRAVAEDELLNAKEVAKTLAVDSRLGWEPSMGYLTDSARLAWKIKRLRHVLAREMPEYLRSLRPS